MAMMYPCKWPDGSWRYEIPPKWSDTIRRETQEPEQLKEWIRRGFFKDREPMSRRVVRLKSEVARTWLQSMLYTGPRPAREILSVAKREGISEWSLRRAKRHLKVKSLRMGGVGTGRCNPWIWQLSVAE